MKPENAGKDKHHNLKQNSQTQGTYDIQAINTHAIYETVTGYISAKIRFMEGKEGAQIPRPSMFPLRIKSRDMERFKTKSVGHLPWLARCDAFSLTSHLTCNKSLYYRQPSCSTLTRKFTIGSECHNWYINIFECFLCTEPSAQLSCNFLYDKVCF